MPVCHISHMCIGLSPAWTQLPVHQPGKTTEDGPSVEAPDTHVEDPDKLPAVWLWPGPTLSMAVVAIWGVYSRWTIFWCSRYGCVCVSFSVTDLQ